MVSENRIYGKVGPRTNADGNFVEPYLGRQGETVVRDWLTEAKLRGDLFTCQQGNAATKLAFAETAYDEDQPQFAIRVPASLTLIPVRLSVILEDMAGTDGHVIWSVCENDIGNGTSTGVDILNAKTAGPTNAGVVARSLYTANATAATNLREIRRWHREYAAAAVTDGYHREFVMDNKHDSDMPVLEGPATLMLHVFASGTAPQGYGEYLFLVKRTSNLI